MRDDDLDAVVRVWHRSGLAAYRFIDTWQRFTLEHAQQVFRDEIAASCQVWVAELDGAIVAYLAMNGSYIARLYVDPSRQRSGIGTALLAHARERNPTGLELHTHQKNTPACAFYEKHGFVAVKYGISPPPENEPDVEYHWRPPGACWACRVLAGRSPGSVVSERDEVAAVVNPLALNPGHVLVMPRRHIVNLYELPDALAGPVLLMAAHIARAAKRALAADGVTLRQNNDLASDQHLFHFHLHVIPRFVGDAERFNAEPRLISLADQAAIAGRLRAVLVA